MPVLLSIDTATDRGAVALSQNGEVVSLVENNNQKEHASFLHAAIKEVLIKGEKQLADIDALVVVTGPGSYTGLRVGLSAAKGLCYIAGKPLIAVNTLQAVALAASLDTPSTDKQVLIVPMIDARRMEVFTAVYDVHNQLHTPPVAAIVDEFFLKELRENNSLIFAGNGSKKLQSLVPEADAHFSNDTYSISHVVSIGEKRFMQNLYEDVAYYEPFYLKPFFSTAFVKK